MLSAQSGAVQNGGGFFIKKGKPDASSFPRHSPQTFAFLMYSIQYVFTNCNILEGRFKDS